ncbi:MAG: metallophosphoesterase [Pseudobdellovibrionaceae bacterium]
MSRVLQVLFFIFLIPQNSFSKAQTFAIIGDAGRWNKSSLAVRNSILAAKVSDLILPGDNHYDPPKSYDEIWGPWKRKKFNFRLVALGNHTLGYLEEMKYFEMPQEFFSVVKKDTRWIILNSDNEDRTSEQMKWLEGQLQISTETFVFIILHHPPYTISKFHSWKEKSKFQIPFRALLWKYRTRITALIVGHDHMASLVSLNEIPMIVSGAVQDQRPEKPMSYSEDDVQVQNLWTFKKDPHWARLDINSAKTPEVWLNFVNADRDSVACSARIFPRPILRRSNCKSTGLKWGPIQKGH